MIGRMSWAAAACVAAVATSAPAQADERAACVPDPRAASAIGDITSSATTDGNGLTGSTRIDAGFSGPLQIVAEIPDGSRVVFELLVTGSTCTGASPLTGEVR